MRSAYLTMTLDTAEEAERLYALLSDGGQIFKFGTSWMLLQEPF
jgi:PhnB protein